MSTHVEPGCKPYDLGHLAPISMSVGRWYPGPASYLRGLDQVRHGPPLENPLSRPVVKAEPTLRDSETPR